MRKIILSSVFVFGFTINVFAEQKVQQGDLRTLSLITPLMVSCKKELGSIYKTSQNKDFLSVNLIENANNDQISRVITAEFGSVGFEMMGVPSTVTEKLILTQSGRYVADGISWAKARCVLMRAK